MHRDMPKGNAALTAIPVPEDECELLLLLGGAALIPRKGKTPQLLLFLVPAHLISNTTYTGWYITSSRWEINVLYSSNYNVSVHTEKNGLSFIETSALDSTNVEAAFQTILTGESSSALCFEEGGQNAAQT